MIIILQRDGGFAEVRANEGRQQENDDDEPGKHQAGRHHCGVAVAAVNEGIYQARARQRVRSQWRGARPGAVICLPPARSIT